MTLPFATAVDNCTSRSTRALPRERFTHWHFSDISTEDQNVRFEAKAVVGKELAT
jgi:hypothetical protein